MVYLELPFGITTKQQLNDMSSVITEAKLKALTMGLYHVYHEKYGRPLKPLKQVVVGNLNDNDDLAITTQILGKSHIAFTDEFLGSTHTGLLLDTIKHELAHVWAGVEHKHDKYWIKWAERFGAKITHY